MMNLIKKTITESEESREEKNMSVEQLQTVMKDRGRDSE